MTDDGPLRLGLEGRIALVTGGSKGIGLACARRLLAEGARVAVCSRGRANLDRACGELDGEVVAVAADLSDADQALAAVDEVEGRLGPIDILINSAGAARRTPPPELTPDAWRAAMDAKFFSYVNVIDPVVKRMAARRTGVIVNIIGSGGKVASPTHLAGGAANAALMLATAGLGSAYAGAGVRVVGINPGVTETERVAQGLEAEAALKGGTVEAARAAALAALPIGRFATPDDIARVACFLASDAASYVTGVTLSMNGGQHPTVV